MFSIQWKKNPPVLLSNRLRRIKQNKSWADSRAKLTKRAIPACKKSTGNTFLLRDEAGGHKFHFKGLLFFPSEEKKNHGAVKDKLVFQAVNL